MPPVKGISALTEEAGRFGLVQGGDAGVPLPPEEALSGSCFPRSGIFFLIDI